MDQLKKKRKNSRPMVSYNRISDNMQQFKILIFFILIFSAKKFRRNVDIYLVHFVWRMGRQLMKLIKKFSMQGKLIIKSFLDTSHVVACSFS